jgi:hypothetical protein
MSYTTDDATRALFQFHLDRRLSESQIMQPAASGYDDDGYEFVHRGQNDEGEDAIDFTVKFTDDLGTALVSFSDGERGTVNIHDGEDADEDDDDEDDDDEDDDDEDDDDEA